MKLEIKSADLRHLNDIVEIENECFSHPWSENLVKSQLEGKFNKTFVAVIDGEAVGYISLTKALDEGQIANVAVKERARRQGVAKALLSRVCEFADDNGLSFLTLEVRDGNSPAIALYENFGFARVGLRKKYYDGKFDAILMTLER